MRRPPSRATAEDLVAFLLEAEPPPYGTLARALFDDPILWRRIAALQRRPPRPL